MSKKIGLRKTKSMLRRIVNERGHEYQYICPTYISDEDIEVDSDSCLYSDDKGNPSCMIGVLLSRVSPETFTNPELHPFSCRRTLILSAI